MESFSKTSCGQAAQLLVGCRHHVEIAIFFVIFNFSPSLMIMYFSCMLSCIYNGLLVCVIKNALIHLSLSLSLSLSFSSLMAAAPPMVLDGSGKEGIHVDTMQDEAQQSQQVSGDTKRERIIILICNVQIQPSLKIIIPACVHSILVLSHSHPLTLSLSLSLVDIPVSSMEGPGMSYQNDFMETQPHSMSSSQGTATSG